MGNAYRHVCEICGSVFYSDDILALYCPSCEYELKKVRLADEESVEEWIEKMHEENTAPAEKPHDVPSLHFFFERCCP